jgi:hypothetical protein
METLKWASFRGLHRFLKAPPPRFSKPQAHIRLRQLHQHRKQPRAAVKEKASPRFRKSGGSKNSVSMFIKKYQNNNKILNAIPI